MVIPITDLQCELPATLLQMTDKQRTASLTYDFGNDTIHWDCLEMSQVLNQADNFVNTKHEFIQSQIQ